MKRWLIGIALVVVIFWISGGFQRYIPGQEDNPALAKVRLCEVASNAHEAFIEATIEDGMVVSAAANEAGVYVFKVKETRWAEFPIESREVLAIAGWCQVANGEGRGVSAIIGATSGDEIAGVVDGEYALAE